ncbi:SLC13 family permease [Cupriavidus basilensis]
MPNATTVILIAPSSSGVAVALEVDIVGPMVLTAIVSNSAGLLTLVGDPATFLVGSSIGMTFGEYLHRVSLGGVVALLVIVPLLPLLMPDLWRLRRPLPPRAQAAAARAARLRRALARRPVDDGGAVRFRRAPAHAARAAHGRDDCQCPRPAGRI